MAQFRKLNEEVLRTLEVGDLVEYDRGFIKHWGVYIGMYQCPMSSCRISILLAFLFHISFEYSFQ
jgi:hypothetical protein